MKSTKKSTDVNRCFGCGPANAAGLKLRFELDAKTHTSKAVVKLARRFEGAPGFVHGGIIATLMDEAMGKTNKLHGEVGMTRQMEIEYLRPCPLGEPLTVTGHSTKREGRKLFVEGEIHDAADRLLVRSKGLFIVIDPKAFLTKHTKRRVKESCPVAVP